jgi:uncharacterized membrane protein
MTNLRKATLERLSAFSDGVFAVLITVLVLELHPPEAPTFGALVALWHTWLSYAFSYFFIAIVWGNHHYLTGLGIFILCLIVYLRPEPPGAPAGQDWETELS